MRHHVRIAVAVLILAAVVAACGHAGNSATDRQADILADAIAYPRQDDAAGFARAALATTLGESGTLAILEASDINADSYADAAARLVIRIHVPAHQSNGFGDKSTSAFDACYRIEYALPSSELVREPVRVDCPTDSVPITPPSAPPIPRLPADTSAVLARVLQELPPSPAPADTEAALRAALPADLRVDALVEPGKVAVAAGVGTGENIDCRVAVRIGDRVRPVYPDRDSLLPGEVGCRAALAFLR